VALVLAPVVPIAVEVDPETPVRAVPFRLLALVPSLLGLPLRLAVWLAEDRSLLAELLIVAFESIHPPAVAAPALAVERRAVGDALCATVLSCVMQPVIVTVFAELLGVRVGDVVRGAVVAGCPLLLEGVDRVAGCWFDPCGYVCADATASDNTAAAQVLPNIHLCIYPPVTMCWCYVEALQCGRPTSRPRGFLPS
jgi:hypothetical protein